MAVLTVHPCHPYAPLRAVDLERAPPELLPPVAKNLIQTIGMDATLGLLNHWPGVELRNIPKTHQTNPHGQKRWQQLTRIFGKPQTVQAFALAYGGIPKLDIPTCLHLRNFRRNEAMKASFDTLTTQGLSSPQAIQEITLEFAPISTRQVQKILNTPD